jgi:cell wall-associated NlpC family hydrolase
MPNKSSTPNKDVALTPATSEEPRTTASPLRAPDTSPSAPPITRARILTAARAHLGAPFRHQGRSPAGMDCVGLLVLVGRTLGYAHRDVTGYSRRATGRGFLEHFHAALDEITPQAARPGDVLVFVETVYPCHTGILSAVGETGTVTKANTDIPHLIHAHALRGSVLEEPFLGEWPAKLRFAFRFRGLEESD